MPRDKIIFPEKFFELPIIIPVRITDINYGDHVGNDALVSIIHEARMQFLQHHGFTELDIEGTGLIMSDLLVEFKNESFYKDSIEVKVAVTEISRVSFQLVYQLTSIRNEEKILLANARTTMVSFDYGARKVIAIPEALKKILEH